MKIEPRGKYPGVKVHLDDAECQALLGGIQLDDYAGKKPQIIEGVKTLSLTFTIKLAKKIRALMAEQPDLLQPRTPEQIKTELELEFTAAQTKLANIADGKAWNK